MQHAHDITATLTVVLVTVALTAMLFWQVVEGYRPPML